MTAPNPISVRLEHVRTRTGHPDVKAFWEALCKEWEAPTSYESARFYHMRGRAPSVEYVTRVSDRFGVSLDYLLKGDGPMFWSEVIQEQGWAVVSVDDVEGADEAGWRKLERVWSAFPPIRSLPAGTRLLFIDVWAAYSNIGWVEPSIYYALDEAFGQRLAALILAPFEPGPAPHTATDEFNDFAVAMLQALKLATRVPRRDDMDEPA